MPIRILSTVEPSDYAVYHGLVMRLLAATLYFHFHHLKAPSHPTHVVLGELYPLTQSYADKLAETLQGADFSQGQFRESVDVQMTVPLGVGSVSYLNDLITQVQSSYGTDPALGSLVQEIEGALCGKRYLLQLAVQS